MTWPQKEWQRGRSKRSKESLIQVLKDSRTYEGKTLWAIGIMKKLKFFTTAWEYTLGMKKLTQVGRWDAAIELWDDMKRTGLEQNRNTYSAAIVAFNCGGKWQKAVATLDEMRLNNKVPNKIGTVQALMACESGAQWEKALFLLDDMWERGERPDEESYMPAIRACENAGQMERGDKLFWQMREQTKLARVEEEIDMGVPSGRSPPKAPPAPWRVPGAVALDAYDPPKLLQAPRRPKPRSRPPWKRPPKTAKTETQTEPRTEPQTQS